MLPWQSRIGRRVFLALMSIMVLLCVVITGVMHTVVDRMHFKQFRNYNRALAETLAASIDGTRHARLNQLESVRDPYYNSLSRYLRQVQSRHPYIDYIYTLNFNPADDEFTYAVDATLVEADTIWVESSDYSFYIQVQPDDIRLIHNESELADAFTIGADLRVEFDRISNTISVNSQSMARINSTAPTVFALLDGSGVILGKNRREYVWEPEGDSVYFDLSFSAKGDPASDPGSGYVENEADLRWLRKKFNNNNAAVDPEVSRGTYGDYISAYGVIHNDRDEPVGLICLDISAGSILAFRATLVWLSASIFLLAILLALLLSILLTRYITRPLRMFTLAIQDYRNGQLTTQVKWESADEFGDLAHSMNTMASSLHDAHGRIVSINEAFRRFVPGDFLRFLNRNDVTQIRLGDQIQKQMTVL
ncbi:MAG: HAMP domain-containing protein, partial [Leptospiraceae bacterium]|nr:HAMP domain-containing protein [Leptospiraceae bacterium]